jgi:hypothetical protein
VVLVSGLAGRARPGTVSPKTKEPLVVTLIETAVAEDAKAILTLQKLVYQTEAALYGDDIP